MNRKRQSIGKHMPRYTTGCAQTNTWQNATEKWILSFATETFLFQTFSSWCNDCLTRGYWIEKEKNKDVDKCDCCNFVSSSTRHFCKVSMDFSMIRDLQNFKPFCWVNCHKRWQALKCLRERSWCIPQYLLGSKVWYVLCMLIIVTPCSVRCCRIQPDTIWPWTNRLKLQIELVAKQLTRNQIGDQKDRQYTLTLILSHNILSCEINPCPKTRKNMPLSWFNACKRYFFEATLHVPQEL